MTVDKEGRAQPDRLTGDLPDTLDGSGSHPLANIDRTIHAPARLMVMTYLYVVESVDFIFLLQLTGLTWGNLSSHLGKLEDEGYVEIEKTFVKKKSHTMIRLTTKGRSAFKDYKRGLQQVLEELPD
jgi:DNA-binding MarR family transcriptional regulator